MTTLSWCSGSGSRNLSRSIPKSGFPSGLLAGPTASEGVTTFVNDLARKQNVTPAEFEEQFFKNMRPTSLLKRFLKPEEVASVVVYVCSPEASAVNGAAIRAEGGVIKAVF